MLKNTCKFWKRRRRGRYLHGARSSGRARRIQCAAGRLVDAGEQIQQCGLAAVRADDRVHRPRLNVSQIVDRIQTASRTSSTGFRPEAHAPSSLAASFAGQVETVARCRTTPRGRKSWCPSSPRRTPSSRNLEHGQTAAKCRTAAPTTAPKVEAMPPNTTMDQFDRVQEGDGPATKPSRRGKTAATEANTAEITNTITLWSAGVDPDDFGVDRNCAARSVPWVTRSVECQPDGDEQHPTSQYQMRSPCSTKPPRNGTTAIPSDRR